ncbi:MAG TPA: beta-galactosidase [Acidobacteriaceae bacterium]|nr:beta-galactosidase [Acidobacteriaceae bacterium]
MPYRRFRHIVLLGVALSALACEAAPVPKLTAATAATQQTIRLGAAWYPEQWPERMWEQDLQLMQDAHFNVVRIGEFAWSSLEPSEGHYELDWMARAIALAGKHHIAVVIGTPTDAPPAWLTSKYPDTLRVDENGRRAEHGGRRQFNYASPRYRQFCAEIVAQLAQRFGHDPNVIGWQIGNEYTDESFDTATKAEFQQFLRAKYKTLDNLNAHWATAYWSQTYSAWSQIPMQNTGGNPGLLLEHKHFVTATWRSFQKVQLDVLRRTIAPSQFITTNIGGLAWSDNWDHYAITADLDLASWDDYVGQGHLDAAKNAMLDDFVRGWKRQNFWVMETEPGSVNWAPVNNSLWPGETRALAWQDIGHGADAILYWQWRDALNGQEQYHGAITGPDGKPLPIYAEIAELGRDLDLTRAALAGTSPHAEIALLYDYDSRWAIDFQPHTREYDQQQVLLRFYKPLAATQPIDIVDPNTAPLEQYKLLVAPSLNVIDETLAAKLVAYVKQGGHLLLGPRSGMKDDYNSVNPQRQPGPLVDALGGRVEQYYALDAPVGIHSEETPSSYGLPIDRASKADIWGERLKVDSSETHVVLRYGKDAGWLADQPAMIERSLGKGMIAYLGTLPDPIAMATLLARSSFYSAEPPANIETCVRGTWPHPVLIVINHGNSPAKVHLYHGWRDLLPESATHRLQPTEPSTTEVSLPPQGVAVLVSDELPNGIGELPPPPSK